MKKMFVFLIFALLITTFSCGHAMQNGEKADVIIKTAQGDIRIKLYDKTAAHKKNYEKLIQENFFDGLLFHRVIKNFMIQGGDPDSRNAQLGERLGGGSLDYTLPAEIIPEYFHKWGAVAAARRGDASNPEKRSSSSQFYIVQGRVFSHGELDTLEMVKNQQIFNDKMRDQILSVQEEMQQYRDQNDRDGFNLKMAEIREKVDSIMEVQGIKFRFTKEQRQIYTTVGGYPSLDGDYTVFGEVVEGMEVVDKISEVDTDQNDRPIQDIQMKIDWIK
ncbi:MAG: peptidylprolyl isomerase [Mariniphaga sp.]|nr:peptidylprolyl isomerase [Mariniphaga sp.]MDD4424297.1 peptidylprolyl isomerase [Mariniphaga sp.]